MAPIRLALKFAERNGDGEEGCHPEEPRLPAPAGFEQQAQEADGAEDRERNPIGGIQH